MRINSTQNLYNSIPLRGRQSVPHFSSAYTAGRSEKHPQDNRGTLMFAAKWAAIAGLGALAIAILKENNIHPLKIVKKWAADISRRFNDPPPQQNVLEVLKQADKGL